MRTTLILIAGAIVLAANGWALLSSWHNRREPAGGTVELTERELRLLPMLGESTVMLARLEWDSVSDEPWDRHRPQWLDQAKLVELGFDCSVPVTNSLAQHHYDLIPAAAVILVLEYEGEAWRQTEATRKPRSHLFIIDAGKESHLLRRKYPDPARFILMRGVVKPYLRTRDWQSDTLLDVPRLGGWVQTVLPPQIFVPKPFNEPLAAFRTGGPGPEEQGRIGEPRFAAKVFWGADFEPWVKAVRLLAGETESADPSHD